MLLKLKNCTFMYFLPDLAICFCSRSTSMCALLFSLLSYFSHIFEKVNVVVTPDLYLAGTKFESQLSYQLSSSIIVVLGLFKQMTGQYFHKGHGYLILNPYPNIIHLQPHASVNAPAPRSVHCPAEVPATCRRSLCPAR
jgi:hypothetical protein